ncbi:MAG: hypothetical protein IIC64_11065 [SAR324 cluster bacterium]|nr:hypothetical protein [SAR324 cluster bacterium]
MWGIRSPAHRVPAQHREIAMDALTVLFVLAAHIALQAWILPRLGIST